MPTAVPSGAVSGATPSGGVVQGIFISESMNNGRVPKEDVEAAIKMKPALRMATSFFAS